MPLQIDYRFVLLYLMDFNMLISKWKLWGWNIEGIYYIKIQVDWTTLRWMESKTDSPHELAHSQTNTQGLIWPLPEQVQIGV